MNSLSDKLLHAAAADLSRLARGDQQLAARVVGEALLALGATRQPLAPEALRALLEGAGATVKTGALSDVQPLAVLSGEPRNERERAVLSVLLAWHLRALGERSDAPALAALLPALDALELGSPYAPYSALRAVCSVKERAPLAAAAGSVSAGSERARAALRTLRELGDDEARTIEQPMDPALLGGADAVQTERDGPTAPTLAGELEGSYRGFFARSVGVLTGYGLARGALSWLARLVFSFRRPITVTLERNVLRVVGHTELLGRTLRTMDVRLPLGELVELRREARYPLLPAVLSVFGLGLGALFGARAVVEGAGVSYFPLIALGFGFVLGGLLFEFVLRALFPGVRGRVRLLVRSRGGQSLELTNLDGPELDRLLAQAERHVGSAA